jgi:NAD(P)-dependent dehydrogenase (short-subunit alcohol dehydrogenase family)
MGRLSGKRALVTGAERGIGRAIALGLAREGADVLIGYYQAPEQAAEATNEIIGMGRAAVMRQLDISQSGSITEIVALAFGDFGGVDILVNNAAILLRRPLFDITEDDFDRVISVNLRGTFLISQHVARQMVETGTKGSIINISSVSSERAALGLVHYQAAKAGVYMLTRGMALELAPHGIRVNTISPGLTITDLNRDLMSDPVIHAQRVSAVPLGRAGQPEDHIGAAVFLASDESSWITGAEIVVDGGLTVK